MVRSTSEYQLPFEPKEQNISSSSKRCNICTFLKNLSSGKLKWANQELLYSSKTSFLTFNNRSLWKKFLIASNNTVIFLKFLILYLFTNVTARFHSFLSYRPIILIWQFHLKGIDADESLAEMIAPEPSLFHISQEEVEKSKCSKYFYFTEV